MGKSRNTPTIPDRMDNSSEPSNADFGNFHMTSEASDGAFLAQVNNCLTPVPLEV
jgi:hypothetical protein